MTPSPDHSLEFKLAGTGPIPCEGSALVLELVGAEAPSWEKDLLQNAAAGVLDYFRHELQRTSVSVGEFCVALEAVLHGFGLTGIQVGSGGSAAENLRAEADLRELVGDGLELAFFQRLRQEMRRLLEPAPALVRFYGLRPCVMQLAGARRWSPRCQNLKDRIVDYLRSSLRAQPASSPCGLVVH
jgi:hypothetical protein